MNSTIKTMTTAPIRDIVGRLHLRQCHPKLRCERPTVIQKPTTVDIEMRIRRTLLLIAITRGK